MKKRYGLILCLTFVVALTGCGNNDTAVTPEPVNEAEAAVPSAAEPADETEAAMPSAAESIDETEAAMPSEAESAGEVDVDLSTMSATMVYSEVYNMMTEPDEYVGKTIKMDGTCSTYHDEQTGKDYYACIVKDATACCSQGIEFELEHDEYPKQDAEITVIGTFQTYMEGENMYCVLKDAQLLIL